MTLIVTVPTTSSSYLTVGQISRCDQQIISHGRLRNSFLPLCEPGPRGEDGETRDGIVGAADPSPTVLSTWPTQTRAWRARRGWTHASDPYTINNWMIMTFCAAAWALLFALRGLRLLRDALWRPGSRRTGFLPDYFGFMHRCNNTGCSKWETGTTYYFLGWCNKFSLVRKGITTHKNQWVCFLIHLSLSCNK